MLYDVECRSLFIANLVARAKAQILITLQIMSRIDMVYMTKIFILSGVCAFAFEKVFCQAYALPQSLSKKGL